MSQSYNILILFSQHIVYTEYIKRLQKGLKVSKELSRLDIFIDSFGIVRVDGRITHSDLLHTHKHPILLPSFHRLVNLIINHDHHVENEIVSAQALQAYLQQEYWIHSARRAIRSRLWLYVSYFQTRPPCVESKMADLPKYRVHQSKPFAITGVYYAGLIAIKRSGGQSTSSMSAYIYLFVCTVIKALHLELEL